MWLCLFLIRGGVCVSRTRLLFLFTYLGSALFLNFYLLFIYFLYILAASGLSCSMRDPFVAARGIVLLQRAGSLLWGLGFALVVASGFSLSSCGTGSRTRGLCSL